MQRTRRKWVYIRVRMRVGTSGKCMVGQIYRQHRAKSASVLTKVGKKSRGSCPTWARKQGRFAHSGQEKPVYVLSISLSCFCPCPMFCPMFCPKLNQHYKLSYIFFRTTGQKYYINEYIKYVGI